MSGLIPPKFCIQTVWYLLNFVQIPPASNDRLIPLEISIRDPMIDWSLYPDVYVLCPSIIHSICCKKCFCSKDCFVRNELSEAHNTSTLTCPLCLESCVENLCASVSSSNTRVWYEISDSKNNLARNFDTSQSQTGHLGPLGWGERTIAVIR